jgi:hypothetical protein
MIRPMTETCRRSGPRERGFRSENTVSRVDRPCRLLLVSSRSTWCKRWTSQRCAHDRSSPCGEHGEVIMSDASRCVESMSSHGRPARARLIRPMTSNDSSFRSCSVPLLFASRRYAVGLDTPRPMTHMCHSEEWHRTVRCICLSFLKMQPEGMHLRIEAQAGFMQPRDSVASRNSARKHWPYNKPS